MDVRTLAVCAAVAALSAVGGTAEARAPGARLFCAVKQEGGGWAGMHEIVATRPNAVRNECDAYGQAISAARRLLQLPGAAGSEAAYVCLVASRRGTAVFAARALEELPEPCR